MTVRRLVAAGAAVAVAAVAVGAFVLFWGDEPEEVDLASAIQAAATSAASTPSVTPASGSTDNNLAASDGELTGTWSVVNDGSSFVGYRVQEELARIGTATAVGRTSEITGTLEFDGAAITAVSVEADLSTLASDDDRRDQQLQRQALETGAFPTATFVLTEPISLDSVPAEGQTIAVDATGELTVHGVTQTVTIPLQGAFVDGRVVVVGSTVLQLADYDIDAPESMAVLSVDDEATLELQLVFAQA